MQIDTVFARLLLERELQARQKKNPRYSIRAFADYLDLDSSLVLKLLKGQRAITTTVGRKIEKALRLTAGVLDVTKAKSVESTLKRPSVKLSSEDERLMMEDWQSQGMFARCCSGDFNGDYHKLAQEFDVSVVSARLLSERLVALNLIQRDTDGRYRASDFFATTTSLEPAQRLQKQRLLQRSYLGRLTNLLEANPKFCVSRSICFSMSPVDVPLIEKLMLTNQVRLTEQMDQLGGKNSREIFAVQINLIPLSKEGFNDYSKRT